MKQTFLVKEKSINHFFQEHGVRFEERDCIRASEISCYHLLTDEIYLKKSSGIEEEQEVIFELKDVASGSRKELISTYKYMAGKYDDVRIKLTLIDYKVDLIIK